MTAQLESNLPPPLVPSDCDVRDMHSMMLELSRLDQSKAWLRSARVPFLAFYLMNLWKRCFHQFPAGSIENDDDVLCDAAKCPPADWDAMKPECLRGWVVCSDGRIYHPVVAEKALELWASKLKRSHVGSVIRARKQWERKGKQGPQPEILLVDWLKANQPATYDMADKVFTPDEIAGWSKRLSTGQSQMSDGQSDLSSGQVEMSSGQASDNGDYPLDGQRLSNGQVQMSDGKPPIREGKEIEGKRRSTIPMSPDGDPALSQAFDAYNSAAETASWPLAQKLTDRRTRALRQRLADAGGIQGWRAAMQIALESNFLRNGGTGDHSNWRPDLDFFLQEKSFTKLMEGGFTAGKKPLIDRIGSGARSAIDGIFATRMEE